MYNAMSTLAALNTYRSFSPWTGVMGLREHRELVHILNLNRQMFCVVPLPVSHRDVHQERWRTGEKFIVYVVWAGRIYYAS